MPTWIAPRLPPPAKTNAVFPCACVMGCSLSRCWPRGRHASENLIEELSCPWIARVGEKFPRRPALDQHAAVGEVHAVRDLARKAHLVRHDHAGHPVFGELADGDQHALNGLGV